MKLHDEDGRSLRKVYVTVSGSEAEALLKMVQDAERGVRQARHGPQYATDFMFVLEATEAPPESHAPLQ